MATTPSPLPHDPTRPPSCSWRGLLIDSARTFWTVPVMELIITVMARYRLNVLHWHLTDNAGWRVPIPGYPALTSIGAQIPRAPEDWYDHACAPERSGTWRTSPARTSQGFYSDANIRHLVRFAAQRNIRIIPEISIPSCAGAAIRAYPHMGNPTLVHAPMQERNTTLWPIASSLHFIEAALHHVCDLFPSPIIHIGAPKTDWSPWEKDPTLERAGLTSGRDIERLFIERAMRTLHFHGRRAATWETVTRAHNCPPPGTILLSSRHSGSHTTEAASSGAPWVLADSPLLTLSHPTRPSSPTASPATARQLYELLLQALHSERLKGIEAVAWSTSVTSPDLLFYHLLPRLLVIAEIAWHGDDALPWEQLAPLIDRDMAYLRQHIPYWNPQRT